MRIAIIGLGYVGLPLAIEFGKSIPTIGLDINEQRISELNEGLDTTLEASEEDFKKAVNLSFTSNEENIADCNFFIVTVPTPINSDNKPDLTLLERASYMVGNYLSHNDIVIYESTVYPGATEEVCVPILEKASGLKFNEDFYCGYSPERINPGDKERTLTQIKKIVSGSTPDATNRVNKLYQTIIEAGTVVVNSIKVAEAAKVIENTQRDLNIALINELAIIFEKLGINTQEVVDAAATKWNFQRYMPGIVGGHCIGVDPYYLTYKSLEIGYKPEVILAGRHLNDNMGNYIAEKVLNLMKQKEIDTSDANILIMGFSFKENCPDHRNSRVIDILNRLEGSNVSVDIYDPWVNQSDVETEYSIKITSDLANKKYDSIIIAVAHDEFKKMDISEYQKLLKEKYVIYDVKSILDVNDTDGRL
jgi:UDP-N-acetyl-D-glucosamine/UDP-N-acetyl-D-galactosamine dehydrogenase